MSGAMRDFFLKERTIQRGGYWLILLGLAVLAISIVGLAWLGKKASPLQFGFNESSGIEPLEYPAWRKASDWLAGRKYVLLTFDDGPYGKGVDERILAILAKHDASAIFFEVCAHVTEETRDVPRKILSGGHMLGNHSFNHVSVQRLTGDELAYQVGGCADYLQKAAGVRPGFFRPPWGQTSPAALQAIHAAGMRQVLWNANSGDTWLKKPIQIEDMAFREVSTGVPFSVLLMHSYPVTADALDSLLTRLEGDGARFVLPKK